MKQYIVGGFVRDTLLGLEPKDIDHVVVGATVDEMTKMFGNAGVGQSFHVWLDRDGNEWAMARRERTTGNKTQDFEIDVSGVTLEEDLSRRDFTINAMAFDANGNLIDPYNGKQDLDNKLIRHVSDAFIEDPLRVLRAARFLARYSDFTIPPETVELCKKMVAEGMLSTVSTERFWTETEKALSHANVDRYFKFLIHIGFLPNIMSSRDYLRLNCINKINASDMDMTTLRYAALNQFNCLDAILMPPKWYSMVSQVATSIALDNFQNPELLYNMLVNIGFWSNRIDLVEHGIVAQCDDIKRFALMDIKRLTADIKVNAKPGIEYGRELAQSRIRIITEYLSNQW